MALHRLSIDEPLLLAPDSSNPVLELFSTTNVLSAYCPPENPSVDPWQTSSIKSPGSFLTSALNRSPDSLYIDTLELLGSHGIWELFNAMCTASRLQILKLRVRNLVGVVSALAGMVQKIHTSVKDICINLSDGIMHDAS